MNYNVPFLPLLIVGLYVLSYWLVKAKRLSLLTQRRMWNMALGIFFLVSATSGLIMAITLSYRIFLRLPFNLLFWHVEAGIGFAVVAIFHILWHSAYFMAMLKRR